MLFVADPPFALPAPRPRRTPDWRLLERWREGNASAGDELARRYQGLLSRFFRNKVSNVDDACDLAAETMLACTRGQHRIRDTKSFRSYVFGVACNQLRQYYQRLSKRPVECEDFDQCCASELGGTPMPAAAVFQREQTDLLVHGLRSLPLSYQIVLELALFEDMSGRQIGELLELPTATVHTRLRRGKARLAAAVNELSAAPGGFAPTVTDLAAWAEQLRERANLSA